MYVKRTMADKKVSISAGIWDLYDLMYEISSQAKVSVRRVNDIISLKTLETSNGTVTDIDGNFKLEVNSEDAILVVSFVGYQSLEISVNGRSSIEVLMTPDLESLDEVVIVAYGEQSKQKVTGSIQKVDAEELQEIPVAQVTQKLQGKLAGVQILQNTGTPGSGMSVRVRGQASISAGSDPLYVVDGFPITGNISNMNPDEIESITILKDASATSLYGSRAANGVVLVTTKRAKGRENQISFSSYYGIQQIPESGKPDMMNATEFAQFKKEIFEENNRDVPEAYQNPEQYGEGTNWFDLLTRNAPIQNYSLSIKGSRDKFNTSIVGGYFKQEGVLLNSEFERISLRANMDYEVNDNIRVGLNLAPTFTNSKSPQTDGVWYETGGILQGALLTNPIYDYKNEDGTIPYGLPNWDNEFFVNGVVPMPNWWHQVQAVKNTSKNMGVLSNIFLEADLLPGLTYKLMAGVDVGNSVSDYFSPSTAGGVFNPGNPDDPNRISGSHSNSFGYSWMLENTLKYGRSIGKHDFDVLAGYTAQAARGESGVLSGSGFPDNRIQTLNAATTITGSTDIQEWSLASVVGRINYSFDNKYVLSAAIRADGSSKFGAQNRWGSFPSISAGWVVSEESFMQSIPLVSFLKLRGSVGVTGNNNVGNYTQYASVVSTNNPFNNVLYGGKSLAGLNNEELGWERTTQTDIGLEVGVLNDRIALSYDYYNKLTTDLLYTVEIPISSGFYNFATNIGDFQFWGHEFALNTKNFVGPFTWNTNFNISFNRNEALKLGTDDAPVRGEFTITEVGKPLGQLYGLQTDGVFEDQAAYDAGPTHSNSGVGTIRFVDQDDDGVVNNDERDYTYLGNTSPKFIYGFTNSFAYKNFDLTIVAQGGYGNKIVNVVERFTGNLDGAFNVNRGVLNRWKSESDPGDGRYGTTRAGTTGPERDWFNDKWIYDASYLTIKNITLGYNLPTQNMKAIQALRVYASIQQALVFTQYPGANPEVSAAGGLFSGADRTTYPVPRTYSLGFNLTL
ncbi:MAG: SusC/RagA family TonB-linked outer membrane protein [Flammeovirgaceae bacterium]|nr:SusC/RagA family TonB-linked outer membrane protein [Flammeovirgaceae bacterium]MBE62580.1 SusC/RagA family TonB-linked outer membrane protein [Flammeovirgaceae bacterium]MBR07348.1 SusC/RagA family TonB-linked outer membrane protein [Rickettsiales bacterium]HCX24340.1 SusC/RagA family TonB-linked outer membrane protein [Cytophagales bacterium]